MFLHEVGEIDKYVYCNNEFKIITEKWNTTLECVFCKENVRYKTFLNLKIIGVTCNDLCLVCDFSNVYQIFDVEMSKTSIEISVFDVNFSDKEKLYSKLKAYLTFG